MSVEELHASIVTNLESTNTCKISWLNRMLAKTNSPQDFQLSCEAFDMFAARGIHTTPETGTLFIKAACRAGTPEKALELLQTNDEHLRIWPTLGGIHYLMINFSLRRDTKSVVDTFHLTKLRQLKPTQRTYHILIRECVDHDLMADAMRYAEECKQENIVPNRVTYNILMNGCRKFNMPNEILELRSQMDVNEVEINDTTVKFTALAHMMLGNKTAAVKAFMEYPQLETKLAEFCDKFFEVTDDSTIQKRCVVELFGLLKAKGVAIPAAVDAKVASVKESLSSRFNLSQTVSSAASSTSSSLSAASTTSTASRHPEV